MIYKSDTQNRKKNVKQSVNVIRMLFIELENRKTYVKYTTDEKKKSNKF